MTPWEHNQKLLRERTPLYRYQAGEDFKAWQEKSLAKLNELLGLPLKKCESKFTVEYDRMEENFREIRFTFQSEEGYTLPCHLLVPLGAQGKLPLFICLQGHSKGMHISLGRTHWPSEGEFHDNGDRDFAPRIVKEGYCALTLEQRNFGECGGTEKGPACYNSAMTALLIGRTTIGERVWDIQRAIDVVLENFSFVDENKIGCMGNSGGGTATFYAGCIDDRIKFVMPSCAVCTYKDSIAAMEHCSCNYVPNIANYFDMGDLAGLIAPRSFVIVAGKDDPIFPLSGVEECFGITKTLYAAAGAPERCKLVVGNGAHRFYADDAWPVMNPFVREECGSV